MNEARFLIRLTNLARKTPEDQPLVLEKLRRLAAGLPGRIVNLRITPLAFEFDLFCAAEADVAAYFSAWSTVGERLTLRHLQESTGPVDIDACVQEARRLWDEQRFWEVHEVLEGVWKTREGVEKELVQGLILGAAAFVHAQKNEMQVVPAMAKDALHRLKNAPQDYYGWDLEKIREALRRASIIGTPL